MEPTTNNASTKIISALIIGLLVGFFAGVFWQERRGTGTVPADISTEASKAQVAKEVTLVPPTTTAKTKAANNLSVGLLVTDQPAADLVEIANLNAKEILWVAVREEKGGTLGNILGAQKVFVGDGQKVIVELLRPTVPGGTYKVVLYKDIGTPAFNYREDVVVEGVEGRFIAK